MSEFQPSIESGQRTLDQETAERIASMVELCHEYLEQDDTEFLRDLFEDPECDDFQEAALNYIYGRLLEQGQDPDEVLQEFGVAE